MNFDEADQWIEEAGKLGGGIAAEFEALQGVITAQTLRYQWIGEGNTDELYKWYIAHLLRLYDIAQRIAPRGRWEDVTYHLEARKPYDLVPLIMKIRAILVTLPEVEKGEEEEGEPEVWVVTPKARGLAAESDKGITQLPS